MSTQSRQMIASEQALTQCQHVAYDAALEIENAMSVPAGRLSAGELRQLAAKGLAALNRVNEIAERGTPDPQFVALLASHDDSPEIADTDPADPRGEDPGYCVAVDVWDRDDGLYLFATQEAAEQFSAAVEAAGGSCAVTDEPITSSAETLAKLIDAEQE